MKTVTGIINNQIVCSKCSAGANDLFKDKKGRSHITGGATLVRTGDKYICTDCDKKGKFVPRRSRRGNV